MKTTNDHTSGREELSYTVYLLRCEGGSFYAGITTDMDRRYAEHASRGPKAARYTRAHPVVALAAAWEVSGRSAASKLERHIKKLTHAQKLALAKNPSALLETWNSLEINVRE